MGKRKKAAKKPTGPRKNEPLATSFACLFCNHEKSVSVKLDRKAGVDLSAAVDVYSEWVDACDSVAKEDTGEARDDYAALQRTAQGRASPSGHRETEYFDQDDEDGLNGYEGEGTVADDEY
ncbi:MAG: hypothetical protein M1818_000153 [Claussenomyces sp. TS43310]|nr:MAG: hypothetical protein M1818_000153 [Claussenomyces sp. TS43310]